MSNTRQAKTNQTNGDLHLKEKPKRMVSDDSTMVEWKDVDWRKLEIRVFKLQKRIFRASSRSDVKAVRKLQKTLMKSWSAKMLAVRRVTQDNQGKKTAGVDGVKSLNPKQRLRLVSQLRLNSKVKPTRRVWIPKPGTEEKRPLGIPTMYDRALQALVKLALEPEWEARFEPNSYGFRPGRSCRDAIEAIYKKISQKARYVLDADIAKCVRRDSPHGIPNLSWEKLRRTFLGQPTNLESKDKGESSMLVKRGIEIRRSNYCPARPVRQG